MAKLGKLPVNKLFIDHNYQREEKPALLRRIRRKFNPAKLGVLEVSERDNGMYAIFDGQHRWIVAKEKDYKEIDCKIHTGLTPQEEAELFISIQKDRSQPQPFDRFKAEVFHGEGPEGLQARAIQAILRTFDKKLGPKPGEGVIAAVTSVEAAYKRTTLDSTLRILQKAWGDEEQGTFEGAMIDGLSRFLMYYPSADEEHLCIRMSEITPKHIFRRAHGLMEVSSFVRGDAIAQELKNVYNTRIPAGLKLGQPERYRPSPKMRKQLQKTA